MLGYLIHAPYWDAILSNVASWCTLLSYFTTMLLLPIYPCWPALSAWVAAWKTLLGCYTKNLNAFVSIHFVNILIHVSISRASVGLLRPGNDRLWSLFYSCLSFGWFFANLPSQAPAATNSHLRSSLLATKAKSNNWYVYRVTQTSSNGDMLPLKKDGFNVGWLSATTIFFCLIKAFVN